MLRLQIYETSDTMLTWTFGMLNRGIMIQPDTMINGARAIYRMPRGQLPDIFPRYVQTNTQKKQTQKEKQKIAKNFFFHLDRGMYAIDFATEEAADRLRSYFGASAEFQRDHTGEAVYAGEVDVPLVNFIYRVSKQLLEKVGNEGTFLQIYQEFLDITTQAQVRTGEKPLKLD